MRRRIARAEHCPPLNKARRWHSGIGILLEVNLCPSTPVAIRVVYISTAGEEFDVASAAEISASPSGEDVGVKDIALISTFGIGRGTEEKELAKIAAGKVKAATRSFGERRNLRGGGFQQICERVLASNGEG